MVFVPDLAPEVTSIYVDSKLSDSKTKSDSDWRKRLTLLRNESAEQKLYQRYRSEFSTHLETYRGRLKETQKLLTGRPDRVLDIGASLGHFGEAARRFGWDVYVTDVSEYAVQIARDEFGLDGFVMGIDNIPVRENVFDLVTLYDVLEHSNSPLELLKQVSRVLCAGGWVHLTTPNIRSWQSRLFGKMWTHIRPDEHLIYFSPETMRSALERSGFEVVKTRTASNVWRVGDMLMRIEKQMPKVTRFLRKLMQPIGLLDCRIPISTGELQVWARTTKSGSKKLFPVKDILDVVVCPGCRSDIQLFEDKEALCTQCEMSFDVKTGVINFSRYSKRRHIVSC